MKRPSILASLFACGVAAGISCSSPETRQTTADILKTGGEIATAVSGDKQWKKTTDSLSRTLGYQDLLPSQEYSIGKAAVATLLSDPRYPLLDDAAVQDYVNRVGLSVALVAEQVKQPYKPYRFIVVDSPELNALSAPGGFVVLTTGLLSRTENEDELAAVLAHEIAHISRDHNLQAIRQAHLTSAFKHGLLLLEDEDDRKEAKKKQKEAADLAGLSRDFDGAVSDVLNASSKFGLGADKEREADLMGARMAAAAGYTPAALRELLQRLPADPQATSLTASHSSPATRAQWLAPLDAELGQARSAGFETRTARHAEMLARVR